MCDTSICCLASSSPRQLSHKSLFFKNILKIQLSVNNLLIHKLQDVDWKETFKIASHFCITNKIMEVSFKTVVPHLLCLASHKMFVCHDQTYMDSESHFALYIYTYIHTFKLTRSHSICGHF